MKGAGPSVPNTAKDRTARVVAALDEAMSTMEKEIKDNGGIYPRNSGRVSLAEVCRMAGVHPITMMGQAHKETTRVKILKWIDGLGSKLIKGKASVRREVTKRAVSAEENFQGIAAMFQAMYQVEIPKRDAELEKLRSRTKELEADNMRLQEQVSKGRVVRLPKAKGGS